jgi:RNA-directed DNA polymerase
MRGNPSHRNWDISPEPDNNMVWDLTGKANSRNPAMDGEKSDVGVVPMNAPNKDIGSKPMSAEAREGRPTAKGNAGQPSAPRTQSRISASSGLEGVRQVAKKSKALKFTALTHHFTPDLLTDSFYRLERTAAPGIDGMTWGEYEEGLTERITKLWDAVQSGRYRALPSRRVYIPKANGKLRPLGIAALEDKIVQQAVTTVLNEIYEEDFLGFSYGFRPGRSQHQALDALCVGIHRKPVNWVLDADIKAFFDTIDHGWMMRFLEHRIADRRMLRLIRKWLKAGVTEDGKKTRSEAGTPQGHPISPLLANIYLHYVFDLWAHQWRQRKANGKVIVIRYADDSIVGFEDHNDLQAFLDQLRVRMATFGLQMNDEKTRIVEFGRHAARNRARRGQRRPETFDFLGFTHYCSETRKTRRFMIRRQTSAKRRRATLKAIREGLKQRLHDPVPTTGAWLTRVVQGYMNYHAVPDNLRSMNAFRHEICRAWLKALRRRSQRSTMTWERFERLIVTHIPKVRACHPYPNQRFDVTTQGRSRMR